MAQRRMFSLKVVDTDLFFDMSPTAQNLYFHLGMRGDDDGFVSSPKKIMRNCGASEDDLKLLVVKKFIIPFQSGIVVIRNWRENNYIQSDRYTPSVYQEERAQLSVENNEYQTIQENVYKLDTQDRLGKDRLPARASREKYRVENYSPDSEERKINAGGKKTTPEMRAVFDLFDDNPARKVWHLRIAEREAAQVLYDTFGIDALRSRYAYVKAHRGEEYCPEINSPLEFLEKMPKMKAFVHSQ